MARENTDTNRVTVAGTVTPELSEFVEDFRWKNRKNRSQVVSLAIESWAKSEGFVQPETGEVPADAADESGPQAPDAEPAPARAKATRAK
jgi:cytochrome oxidase assembly protein ShyY1